MSAERQELPHLRDIGFRDLAELLERVAAIAQCLAAEREQQHAFAERQKANTLDHEPTQERVRDHDCGLEP